MEDIEIKEISCCNCGCTFWITKNHYEELLRNKTSFYCPNGHRQSYQGKSDKEKLKEALEEKKDCEEASQKILDRNVELQDRMTTKNAEIRKLKKK